MVQLYKDAGFDIHASYYNKKNILAFMKEACGGYACYAECEESSSDCARSCDCFWDDEDDEEEGDEACKSCVAQCRKLQDSCSQTCHPVAEGFYWGFDLWGSDCMYDYTEFCEEGELSTEFTEPLEADE